MIMRAREDVITDLVKQWLAKAEADFGLAEHLVSEGRYLDAVGFHTQQAAEKFLKAFLVHHQIEFPKTHNLGELLDLVARADRALADSLRSATELNPYGADIRYPGDLPEMTADRASSALALAAQVREGIYTALTG